MQKKISIAPNFILELLQTLLNYGVLVYMGLLIVVLPFYFEQGYGYIATDKATFFCKISMNMGKVLLPVLILYTITSIAANHAKIRNFFRKQTLKVVVKRMICKISATDFFVGMYGVAVLLSYVCSDYREDALWGVTGWYMGLVPQMILVCGYFLITRFWKSGKWLFYIIIPVSAVVFLLGYLNRFGYYPIEMEYASPSYISTIGNINWYCGYVVPVLFAGVGLFWQCSAQAICGAGDSRGRDSSGKSGFHWKRVVSVMGVVALAAYICLGFATLVTQGSASGILALGVMMVVLFCLSAKSADKMLQFWWVILLLSIACAGTKLLRNKFPEAITLQDGLVEFLTTGQLPIIMTLVSCLALVCTFWMNKKNKYNTKLISKAAAIFVTIVSCVVAVYVILLIVNTIHPGSIGALSENALFTFTDKWGSNRGATWKAGAMCFMEQDFLHKLVGVGPDAMWSYINTDSSETLSRLIRDNFGNNRLTNAHNEWLTVLVNYGFLGLVSFGGIIISAVWSFMNGVSGRLKEKKADEVCVELKCEKAIQISVACGFGILAYTINNIFSFQQVMNITVLLFFLGVGSAFRKQST